MSHIKSGLLFMGFYLMISCAVTPYVVLPDYQDGRIEDKTLLIAPVISSDIEIPEEIKQAFGEGDPRTLYILFFREKFKNILTKVSSFSNIHTSALKQLERLKAIELVVPKNDTTYYYIPSAGEKVLDAAGKSTDFVLFISRLEVLHSYIDVEFGYIPNIKHKVDYVFWDNSQGKIVCYGKAEYIDGVTKRTKNTFQLGINNLAKTLIENTPFRKYRNLW